MTATLNYSGSSGSKDFTVYSVNPYPIELFKTMHLGISGKLAETTVGYRKVISVDFAPLQYDKPTMYWLYGFMFGSGRTVTFDSVTYNVTISGDALAFGFLEKTFFGNPFSLTFPEQTLTVNPDDASTRTLKIVPNQADEGISGNTLSLYSDFLDDQAVQVVKHDLVFVNQDKDDLSFSYRHVLTVNTGAIFKSAIRTWLTEFVQWANKIVDTTAFDTSHGSTFSVVFDGSGVNWTLEQGVKDATSAILVFKEKTPSTLTTPPTVAPAPIYDEVVYDQVVAQ